MKHSRREALARLTLAAATSAMAGPGLAQSLSGRTIRIIVPFAPGGATDIYARLLAHTISAPLGGQNVIVENHPGGAGVVALEKVANANKDGSTLLMTTSTPISAVPHLMKKLPFKVEDFAPVALVGRFPLHVFVHPSVPAKDFRELVAYVKANPGKLSYAYSGVGSLPHLVTEMAKEAIGLDIVGVSYKGAGPAVNDLVAGHVQVYMDVPSPALGFAQKGRLKVLALMSDKRSPLLPDVPTMAEQGYPNLVGFYNRYSLMAPAGTPASTIETLNKAALKAMESGPLRERQESDGASPGVVSPEQLGALMKDDYDKWGSVIRRLGITLD